MLVGTENAMVDHNLFDGVGGNGVWLHGYNRHANITANEMRNIGENGVGFTGETEWVDGTGGNQPRFNAVSGNLIHHLGLYTKQACAVFSAVSCQNLIEDNVFFHGVFGLGWFRSPPPPHTHTTACPILLSVHVRRILIGAFDCMLCPCMHACCARACMHAVPVTPLQVRALSST